MAQGGFSLAGFKELDAQLAKLSAATARAALQRAGTKALLPTLAIAAQKAPYDTGELAASIALGTKIKDEVGALAYATAKRGGASDSEAVKAMRDARREMRGQIGKYGVTIYMGPVAGRTADEVIKGYVQEFGSFSNEPQPYLRPALDEDKENIVSRLKAEMMAELTKSIDRAAARAAKRAGG